MQNLGDDLGRRWDGQEWGGPRRTPGAMGPSKTSEVYKGTGTGPRSPRKMGRTGQSLDPSICAHVLSKFFVHASCLCWHSRGLGLGEPLSLAGEVSHILGSHISWHWLVPESQQCSPAPHPQQIFQALSLGAVPPPRPDTLPAGFTSESTPTSPTGTQVMGTKTKAQDHSVSSMA